MRLPIDFDKAERLIMSAIENGVNYFDTAYVYRNSEAVLGNVLKKNGVREKVFLATKLPYMRCSVHEDFEKFFNIQLERLKTSYIDYYLIHNLSDVALWRSLVDIGITEWIAEKKASGQIKRVGFSFHGSRENFMALVDAYEWDFCQIQYNYTDENYQAGRAGLARAHAKGMPVIVMEPLLGGRLANGLPKKAAAVFKHHNKRRSAASWALRWLWDQPEVTVVLSGMNGADQLKDNLATADAAAPGMLSSEEAALYGPVVEIFKESYRVPCTGCNYCMPCPHGVNIPGCFSAYNVSYSFGLVAGLTMYITGTGANHPRKRYGGYSCRNCGACLKKCPQHIAIPASLSDVTRRLEPFWIRGAIKAVSRLMP